MCANSHVLFPLSINHNGVYSTTKWRPGIVPAISLRFLLGCSTSRQRKYKNKVAGAAPGGLYGTADPSKRVGGHFAPKLHKSLKDILTPESSSNPN